MGLLARENHMEARISFITLGVTDLERATHFYADGLGLPRLGAPPNAAFFDFGIFRLALYPRHLLAAEAGIPADGSVLPGFTLAHNVRSPDQVDRLLETAGSAAGRIVRPGKPSTWGGYTGYFADPDGFLWEVAWNPRRQNG
jgi:catechol 2,3-dioxygenase-like lactoylglutathione lyase family enzyme